MGEIDRSLIDEHLDGRAGVISRRQLIAAGVGPSDLQRMLRRRDLTRVHAGVFVTHTGPLGWEQRAWAALVYAGRAALYLASAEDDPPEVPIHLAVAHGRRLAPLAGVRFHRVRGLEGRVRWNLRPPRVRPEDNALAMADGATDELEVIRLLTAAVGSRRTSAARLREALRRRSNIRRRPLVEAVIDDIASGTCSVLEQGYLTRVEQAHGLPVATRQLRRPGVRGSEYRDAAYVPYGVVVELDGRGHAGRTAQGRDADRDLDDLAAGRTSIRLRWVQVFGTGCRTAGRVADVLAARGWSQRPVRCGDGCTLRAPVEPA